MRITKYTTLKGNNGLPVLIKDNAVNYPENSFNNPSKIVDMMNKVFQADKQTEEICYLLAFDTKMHLKGVFEVSRGTVNLSMLSPREIFLKSLLCGAAGIVLIHNHPSGDSEPSNEDINTTKRIVEVGKLLNIPVQDHIVIGEGEFFSFIENKILN